MFPVDSSNVTDGFDGICREFWKTSWKDIDMVLANDDYIIERKGVEVSKIYFRNKIENTWLPRWHQQ